MTKFIMIHPEGSMNPFSKFYGDPIIVEIYLLKIANVNLMVVQGGESPNSVGFIHWGS